MKTTANGVRRWKPYPEYKDSGVEWLPSMPEDWSVLRLKQTVLGCQNGIWGDEPRDGDEQIACIRVADFDRVKFRVPEAEFTVRSISHNQRRGRLLQKGDLLIEKSGGGDIQPVGVVMLYDLELPAVCSNFVARMPVRIGHSSSFLCYLHASLYAARLNTRSIKQSIGIQNLDSESYLTEQVAIPPYDEQLAIATFLDRRTTKIDALVAKNERLIELLQEKRIALISHAVTKGLDPKVPMRDSGIPGLGTVPAAWGRIGVKRIISFITSGSRGWTEYYSDDGDLFIQSGNLDRRLGLDLSTVQRVVPPEGAEVARTRVLKHDVLVCVTGAYTGNVAVVEVDLPKAYVNQHVALLRPNLSTVIPKFLAYSLSSYGSWHFSVSQYGGTKQGLGLGIAERTDLLTHA